ncbi:hypothetical protein L596_029996 [Steinernema carpocapsae]|uniref:Uncharacterized protein n=1 Tax=Steinernema carpocapsae TaxID=34508 RepID=A0A4U5LRF5_STECR|nr:hypothetical protein L596_029996 [Steinernema carpocapsae]
MSPASPDGSLIRDLERKITEQDLEIEHLKKTLEQTRVNSKMNMDHAEEMERELHELKKEMRSSENSSPRDNEHMSALRLETAVFERHFTKRAFRSRRQVGTSSKDDRHSRAAP